MKEARNQS